MRIDRNLTNMKYRSLGKTDREISEIGFGAWAIGADWGVEVSKTEAIDALHASFETGVNFVDTADVYGAGRSEEIVAEAIKGRDIFVATKMGRFGEWTDSEDSIASAAEASCKRLGVDALDLVQLHCIPTETLKAGRAFEHLEALKKRGLIRNYGVSVETIDEGLFCIRESGAAALQVIFNIFRQRVIHELLPEAERAGVGIIARVPLASGLLSGKYSSGHQFAESDHRNFNADGQCFKRRRDVRWCRIRGRSAVCRGNRQYSQGRRMPRDSGSTCPSLDSRFPTGLHGNPWSEVSHTSSGKLRSIRSPSPVRVDPRESGRPLLSLDWPERQGGLLNILETDSHNFPFFPLILGLSFQNMFSRVLLPLLLGVSLVLPLSLKAQDAKESPAPTKEDILQAIEDLASSEFLKREKAAKLLWNAGRAAEGPLAEAVAKEENLEAKLRAEQILSKFKLGIYPDTPPELVETLKQFQTANPGQRRMILSRLMQQQEFETVANLLGNIAGEERNILIQTLFRNANASSLVTPFLVSGNTKRAEAVLDILSQRRGNEGILAAYHYFSGSIDKAIDSISKSDDPHKPEKLISLYRAKGDMEAALEAAEGIPDLTQKNLAIRSIKISQGDIRAYLESLNVGQVEERLAMDLTLAQLDNDQVKADAKTQELLDLVKENPDSIGFVTKSLIIGDRTEDLLTYVKTKSHDRTAELLFAQRRPGDLLDYLGIENQSEIAAHFTKLCEELEKKLDDLSDFEAVKRRVESMAILIHLARLHLRSGYLKEADRLFIELGDAMIASKTRADELGFLIERAGESLRTKATIILAEKAVREWPATGARVVAGLPLDDAANWWGAVNFLKAENSLEERFALFLDLYPGELENPETEVEEPTEEQVAKAKAFISEVLKAAEEKRGINFFPGIGLRAEALGLTELAEEAFLKHAGRELDRDEDGLNPEKFAPLRALGDFYVRQENWEAAVSAFEKASAIKSNRDPVSVYTLSWAQKNAGMEEKAAENLKIARMLPLGDTEARGRLAEEMIERGDLDLSFVEWEYIFRTAAPDDMQQGRAAQILARKAASEDEWEMAANYYDRLLFSTLPYGPSFTKISSYLQIRYSSSLYRTMAAIKQKDGPTAARMAAAASVQQPADPTIFRGGFPGAG